MAFQDAALSTAARRSGVERSSSGSARSAHDAHFECPPGVRLGGECRHDPDREAVVAGVVAIEAPRHRAPEVVELAHHPWPPRELVGAVQAGTAVFGEVAEVLGMPSAPHIRIVGVFEPIPRVLPQRLELPVTRRSVLVLVGDQHRLRDEAADHVDDVPRVDAVTRDHRGGIGRGEAAREHAEPGEHELLRLGRAASTTSRPRRATSGGVRPHSGGRR